ncbi:unnamed protein product [Acanthoscelides obtectus]|uniref:Uncharacterized protein n=1 Tax=Acanthoscelides obtectus TaxID=200917 RepID=A0A9P0KFJ5_ACAOB|nr:unnamed protein product [Acanthoscelides obtectus]CAK1633521.1 hypothetical protein AOBTE_LOCUS8191 [Acanthoscelides obtectus]
MHLCEDEEVCHQGGTGSTVEDEASAKVDDPASQEKESSNIAESPQIKRIIRSLGKNRKRQPCLVVPRVVPNALIKPSKFSNPQPSKSIPIKMNVTTLEIL